MSVFIDTSAILAIFDADDPKHGTASKTWTALLGSDEEIQTTNYIMVETMSLLQRRFGNLIAGRFANNMVPAMKVLWVDQPLHDAAVSASLVQPGKSGASLVDCASFEAVRRLGSDKVFAYDKHFKSRGYDMLG